MNAEVLSALNMAKYCYIITDPFPDHTEYNMRLRMLTRLERLFWKDKIGCPNPISIWDAHRMGEQAAFKRIEEALNER